MNHRKMPRPSQRRRLPLSIKLRPLKIPKAKRSQRKSRSRKQQIALGMLAAMRCVTVERSIGRMTDVNQVRINELARELEVKAKAILDLLPGLGVSEKKTHSSSIDVDVAEKVRLKLTGGEPEPEPVAAVAVEEEKKEEQEEAAPVAPPVAPPPAPPVVEAPVRPVIKAPVIVPADAAGAPAASPAAAPRPAVPATPQPP